MLGKPAFLNSGHAAAFEDAAVAAAYRHRPSYPEEALDHLARLLPPTNRKVLDIGCGTGFLARPLAGIAERVDAIDVSAKMVAEGRNLPGGCQENLRWIVSSMEDFLEDCEYGLVTAGESLHWMEWEKVLSNIHRLLSRVGWLAVLDQRPCFTNFTDEVREIIRDHSVNGAERRSYDTCTELSFRNLFVEHGRTKTAPYHTNQSVEEYIESFHARSSLARSRMSLGAAESFDQEIRALFQRRKLTTVEQDWETEIVWGRPV